MGALYATSLFIGWNSASTVQPIIAVERSVFYRERAAGYYSGSLYALSQGVTELPYATIQALIYCIITYSLIQFQWTAAKFLWFFLFILLSFVYFTFYGMMAIGITPNKQISVVLSSFLFSLWNLNCGLLIPQPVSACLLPVLFLCLVNMVDTVLSWTRSKCLHGGAGFHG